MRRLALVLLCIALCAGAPLRCAAAESGGDIEEMIPAFDALMRAMLGEDAQYDPYNIVSAEIM